MSKAFAFILFFLYVIFQGALRKWAFPNLGTPLYLLQYALLGLMLVSNQKTNRLNAQSTIPAFQGILMLYLGYSVLEIFNLRGTTNLIVQFYGFAMHFCFVPFVFAIPKIMENDRTWMNYLKWLSFILIGLFLLGISQYFSPQDAFVNRYATDKAEGEYEVAVGSGGRTRITGTFSYLATYASFLCFILHLLFFATLYSLIKKKLNWFFVVAYGMGIVNLFMTGSRGPTVYYFTTEAIVLLYLTTTGQAKFLKNIIPLAALLFIGYVIMQATEAGSTATTDFLDRLLNLQDLETRLEDSFSPLKFIDQTGAVGYGLGTAQFPMEQYLTNRYDMPGYWEEEGERITIELGLIGYFIVMILRWIIFLTCYTITKKTKMLEYKILGLSMTFYQLPFLINLQTNIFNYIDGMFYWIAIGLVYFAYSVDTLELSKGNPKVTKANV